jgi:5-amino-6-(5-phosphoribosylamino)uracil reductase
MRKFEVLFDQGEPAALRHAAFETYGPLGFPPPPAWRPWIFANFVQSLDGIASLKGVHAAGSDLSQSPEDRWLMDLLRAHADAVLLGINTLIEEKELSRTRPRGPVFRIMEPELRELRQQLGRGREKNIFVTGAAALDLSDYAVFDGETVDALVITTTDGAARLEKKRSHPQVRIIVAGEGSLVDLPQAMRILHGQFGLRYLLCEGGPTLYGYMARAGLIDEKFLTVSPVEAGQIIPPEQPVTELEMRTPGPLACGSTRLRPTTFTAPGFTFENLTWWNWLSCRKMGEHQFNRYRRR